MPKLTDLLPTIDLSQESAERLESSAQALRPQAKKPLIRDLLIGLLCLGISLVFFFIMRANFIIASHDQGVKGFMDFLLFVTVNGNHENFSLFFVFALGIGFGIYFFLSVIVRLLDGAAKPGLKSEDTLDMFFRSVLVNSFRLHWVDAYVCLLDQCKAQYGSFEQFTEFWKNVNASLKNDIVEFTGTKNVNIRWDSEIKINLQEDAGDIRKYQVNLHLNVVSINITGNVKKIAAFNLQSTIHIAKVGTRWYIAQKDWQPELLPG